MVEPLILISTYTLKEGKLEDFKHFSEELAKFIEANEPRLIHFEQYINEDGTEVARVQIHPDADSMAFHMQLIRENMGQAFEFLDAAKSYQVYGESSEAIVEQLNQASGPEVPVIVKSKFAGFNRLPAPAASEPRRRTGARGRPISISPTARAGRRLDHARTTQVLRRPMPYSPDVVEGEFCEPRLDGVPRSSPIAKQDYMLRTAETSDVGGADQDEESGCGGVSVARRRDGVPR